MLRVCLRRRPHRPLGRIETVSGACSSLCLDVLADNGATPEPRSEFHGKVSRFSESQRNVMCPVKPLNNYAAGLFEIV